MTDAPYVVQVPIEVSTDDMVSNGISPL
jgi:hypothetical protein